jgi:aminoglycoside 3-N-acetyltransferase
MQPEIQGDLITLQTLQADFQSLGVTSGMTVLLHSSMKSLGGWVCGGPVAVIHALEHVIGANGTLVMPTHSGDLSDPAEWRNPPVKESWWATIRESMPAYEADLTPTWGMGSIPECFRKQQGVRRSSHPQVSFAAWGAHAEEITWGHSLAYCLGEQSPLSRIYDLSGWVLLLGVGNSNNTSIHLAEYRAEYEGKTDRIGSAPIYRDGVREWVEFKDIETDSSDFECLGEDFLSETSCTRIGKVANARAMLIPQREIVDYAVKWLNNNRISKGSE